MGSDLSVAADKKAWSEVSEEGYNVNGVGGELEGTGLHYAAREGKRFVCEVLLQQGANVHLRDMHGRQPLHQAALGGHTDVCELLVSHGADVAARDHQGNTPLMLATYYHCCPAMCKLLLTLDSVNLPGSGSNRALHIAVTRNKCVTVEMLLEYGANANAVNRRGQTALHTAASLVEDSPYLCRTLLSYNAKVFLEDEGGNQPLHLACRHGHVDTAIALVSHSADTNACNNDGRTSLHEAISYGVQYGSWRLCEVLLNHDADANFADRNGDTPCHLIAVRANHCGVDGLRLLSQHGADWTVRNKRGLNVLEVAQLAENRHTVPFISHLFEASRVTAAKTATRYIETARGNQSEMTTAVVVHKRPSLTNAVSGIQERSSAAEQLVHDLLLQVDLLQTEKKHLLERVARLEAQVAGMAGNV